jgi:hypothetical protein
MAPLSYAWVKSFLEHRLDPGESWRCLFAYTRDELVGILPLIRSKHLVGGTQLRGPSDPDTTRSGHALLAVGREREVLSALLEALRDLEPDHLWVKFSGVRDCSPTLRASNQGIRRALVTNTTAERGSLIAVHGSFDAYASGLSPEFSPQPAQSREPSPTGPPRVVPLHLRTRRQRPGAVGSISGDRRLRLEGRCRHGDSVLADAHRVLPGAGTPAGRSRLARMAFPRLRRHASCRALGGPVRAITHPPQDRIRRDARPRKPRDLLFRETVARTFADGRTDEVNCLTDMQWHRNWHMTQAAYRDLRVYPRRVVPVLVGFIECELPVQVRGLAKRVPGLAVLVSKARTQVRAREW